jgi:hypothetical protein
MGKANGAIERREDRETEDRAQLLGLFYMLEARAHHLMGGAGIFTRLDQPVFLKLNEAYRELERMGELPTAALEAVREAWRAMPDADRRRLLNGWSEPKCFKSGADVSAAEGTHTRRYLVLSRADRYVKAFQSFFRDGGWMTPVHVMIGDGSRREEVIDGLRSMLRVLEEGWDHLIAMPPLTELPWAEIMTEITKEKQSGTPETPQAPEPGSKRGKRARKPAAAVSR